MQLRGGKWSGEGAAQKIEVGRHFGDMHDRHRQRLGNGGREQTDSNLIPFLEALFKNETNAAGGNIDDAGRQSLPRPADPADRFEAASIAYAGSSFRSRGL